MQHSCKNAARPEGAAMVEAVFETGTQQRSAARPEGAAVRGRRKASRLVCRPRYTAAPPQRRPRRARNNGKPRDQLAGKGR
eukprot:4701062-Alexandrium_andersonii.AAC.1